LLGWKPTGGEKGLFRINGNARRVSSEPSRFSRSALPIVADRDDALVDPGLLIARPSSDFAIFLRRRWSRPGKKIAAFLPELDKLVKEGLITLEKAQVVVYRANGAR